MTFPSAMYSPIISTSFWANTNLSMKKEEEGLISKDFQTIKIKKISRSLNLTFGTVDVCSTCRDAAICT